MSSTRNKILMFGYRPPPVFGPAVAYETLLRSNFAKHFDVTFINLSVVTNIRELEQFRAGKLVKLAKFVLLELWYLLTHRFALVCYPLAYNRRAFIKDRLLIGLARLRGVPVVLWIHGTGLPRFRESLSPRQRQGLDHLLHSARGVIVLADCLRQEFAGLVAPDRLHMVPIGIEPQPSLPPVTPGEGCRIVYLGALAKTKGIFDLLAALPLVRTQLPAATLVCAGEWFKADEQAAAEQFVRDHNLSAAVKFPGPVHGAAKWQLLCASDICVFPPPAHLEAFGIVLLEAMQAGLPIVATRGGARDEILAEGVNALLVEEQNPADLADKIVKLAGDRALRERMGAANRTRFAGHYTQEHYAQRMATVFQSLEAR